MRALRYDINAMVAFEDAIGEPIIAVVGDQKKLSSFKVLRALYWAGTDIKATLEEAGEAMTKEISSGTTFAEIAENIIKALKESGLLGEKSENPPKKARKA